MDTEQCVPAQHLHVPVLEVESPMGSYDRGIDGRLVIRSTRDGEFRQSGDTYGWRLNHESHGMWVCLWGGNRFRWRGLRLRDLRFEILTRKSQGCDDGSCSGVFLVRQFWLPGREHRRRRETFPPALSQVNYILKDTGWPNGSILLRGPTRTSISPFVPFLG